MKKVLLFCIAAIFLLPQIHAQISSAGASVDIDLSRSVDTVVGLQSKRNGAFCTGINCIRFTLKLNPATTYVNFMVSNPAPPIAAYYQVDCGSPAPLGTPISVKGRPDVAITFCMPGTDNPVYIITTTGASSSEIVNTIPAPPMVAGNSVVCEGSPISLAATTPGNAQSFWTGPNGFSSCTPSINIPNSDPTLAGQYSVIAIVNGRVSRPTTTNVVVKPKPEAPAISSNSPLCGGRDLNLWAGGIPGASYSWTGPNGFNSSLPNNTIPLAGLQYAGDYYVTATVNGCTGNAAITSVIIDQQAVITPGADQTICSSSSSVNLAGKIVNGAGKGVWTTTGSGIFSDGANLQTAYYPSQKDKALGMVSLYLTSTNNASCPASSGFLTVWISPQPTAVAGPDQIVCASDAGIKLQAQFSNASRGVWTSSGTGSFSPASSQANATYFPSTTDKTEGAVKLVWTTAANGACPAVTDDMMISIKQPPVIYTGPTQYVAENNSILLKPVFTGSQLKFSWSPAIFLDRDTVANPLCSPRSSVNYTISATNEFGCVATGVLAVKMIRDLVIPNVFTPNGDGINDTWQVKNLADYSDCHIDIYNRYGQVIYKGVGYSREWNGTSNGKLLSAGTYYYIIDLKTGTKPLSGSVDIVL
jgi:gliding motility-associated-like protein